MFRPWLYRIFFIASLFCPTLYSLQRIRYPLITTFSQAYMPQALHKIHRPALNLAIPGKLQIPKAPMPVLIKPSICPQEPSPCEDIQIKDITLVEKLKTPQETLFALAEAGDIDALMAFWRQVGEPEKASLLEARDKQGNTAFLRAVACTHLEATQFLFTSGSDRFAKNHAGQHAMDLAIKNNDEHMMLLLIQK